MSISDGYKLFHQVIPSPGTEEKTWEALEKRIEQALPDVKTIHIDIIDGKFAPNNTLLDPKPFAKIADKVFLEAHLMVADPITYLKPFSDAGFKRFIGQVEKMPDIAAFVAEGQLAGEVGLGIDIATSIETIKLPLEDLDVVLVMTVKAGFSRQQFMPEMLEKVKKLRAMDEFLAIEVDGGVNDQTITLAKDAGATRFVSTGFIFDNPNPKVQYISLCQRLMQ